MDSFGPSFDDAVEGEGDGFAAGDGAVEKFALGGPAGVVDFDHGGGFGMIAAGAFGEDFGLQSGSGGLGIGGSGGDVFWCFGWFGCLLEFEELDIKDEHAAGSTATGVFAVSEVGGDPEAAFFAGDHELKAFGPAFDDAVERETDGFAAGDGAVEKFAVGGPAGVVDGHFVGAAGLFAAGSGGEDFGGEAGRGLFGIGGNGGYVGGSFWFAHVAGNFGEDGRECNSKGGKGGGL